jgi:Nuclease-related domain
VAAGAGAGPLNYARRQQYRRLSRAVVAAAGTAAVFLLALLLAGFGATSEASVLFLVALGLGVYSRHWLVLARRSRVGARSEDEVRRRLDPLRRDGWWVRHAMSWRGRGDIDSVAIAPNGVGFAIETKTRTYDHRQLGRVLEQARWLGRRRRRWCRRGALAVLCVVRATGVERYEHGVLVVSIDRLVRVLQEAVNSTDRVS